MYKKLNLTATLFFILANVFCKNSSQFISQTIPDNIQPGQSFNVSIVFKNTSNKTWAESSFYRLGSQSPMDNTFWGMSRIYLPGGVAPGEQVTFKAVLKAPVKEGLYNYQWQMVQDGVEWFGEKSELIFFPVLNFLADSLKSSSDNFSVNSHIVSTSFFSWYGAKEGQISSPWIPIEGRKNWTGDAEFWKRIIKQAMFANIDVFYVELIPFMEDKRGNLFLALSQLRREGWDVPKVCPFLDPIITYDILGFKGDCSTEAGKDELIGHYVRFYKQYYSVNTDVFADDYIYTQNGSPVLNIWHIQLDIKNYNQLTRSDVTNRLKAAFGKEHPIFNNNIKMINNAISPAFNFADERINQFEVQEYKIDKLHNGIKSTLLKAGYWDQNVRSPGTLLPRDGGSHYANAWKQVNADATIDRVYIESFNEYDEGSGIYAAKTDTIYRKNTDGINNNGTDVWSSTNDPYEYLKTTALGAAQFNDDEQLNSKILWNNIPSAMKTNETFMATVIVRNEGNEQWSAANNFKFGEMESDTVMFASDRFSMNDAENEIPTFGGIFRGRPLTFKFKITAPSKGGNFISHWGMLKEGTGWFGDTLTKQIIVTGTTNIDEINDEFKIYPNPAGTYVIVKNIKSQAEYVELIDITGRTLKQFKIDNSEYKIQVSDLQRGVYFIKTGNTVKKFIKE